MPRGNHSLQYKHSRALVIGQAAADDARCAICAGPIDYDAWRRGERNPRTPEADHIVPWSQGGSDAVSNLRVTHAHCNQSRGDGRRRRGQRRQPVQLPGLDRTDQW